MTWVALPTCCFLFISFLILTCRLFRWSFFSFTIEVYNLFFFLMFRGIRWIVIVITMIDHFLLKGLAFSQINFGFLRVSEGIRRLLSSYWWWTKWTYIRMLKKRALCISLSDFPAHFRASIIFLWNFSIWLKRSYLKEPFLLRVIAAHALKQSLVVFKGVLIFFFCDLIFLKIKNY